MKSFEENMNGTALLDWLKHVSAKGARNLWNQVIWVSEHDDLTDLCHGQRFADCNDRFPITFEIIRVQQARLSTYRYHILLTTDCRTIHQT